MSDPMIPARERRRSFLVYGFIISLAVHLTCLPFVHLHATADAKEVVPDVMHRERLPTPPPTPRPTPTPRATPPPAPLEKPSSPVPQRRRIKIVTLNQHAPRHGGPAENSNARTQGDRRNGVPDGGPSAAPDANAGLGTPAAAAATPTPRPTPTPLSCARPQVAATTVRALEPETPPMAVQQNISGTVNVVVSLDAQSRIVATRIQNSPSAVLNAAALAAARGSQFRTEIRNCEPVAADYLFSVEFTSQ